MLISSEQAFRYLVTGTATSLVDVRAEKEFAKGHFPGSHNIPILKDEHRHLVGLTYKQEGQERAVAVGHELVLPIKPQLVNRWRTALQTGVPLVMCWRGGMRSEIACSWLQEAGCEAGRISGGYKALRAHALQQFEVMPAALVLAGYTGSRKTELLLSTHGHIDLEGLAVHRGSAFGHQLQQPQPEQATFENLLGIQLARMRDTGRPVLIEDEGNHLGNCFFPRSLTTALQQADIVWLDVELATRVRNVFEDYILQPLADGITPVMLQERYTAALQRIRTKLGGAVTAELCGHLQAAFRAAEGGTHDPDLHAMWIGPLLATYYDTRYQYACDRLQRRVLFRGDYDGVIGFLQAKGYR
jgi:tRNA 2-selenouridine synthase